MTFTAKGEQVVASFKGKLMAFVADESAYEIAQTSQFVPSYQLLRQSDLIASAKRATFLPRYAIGCAGKVWTLKAVGFTERKYVLLNDKTKIGVIYPTSYFNPYRQIVVDLPNEIAIQIQVFMTWIVVNSWSSD